MADERKIIQYYIQRLYDRKLTTMSGGNLSLRATDGIFVTPSAVDKGTLKPADIVKVLKDGTKTGKHKVTSEFPVHQRIYENNRENNAILHSHTPSILGLSVARVLPQTSLIAYVHRKLNGQIALAKYGEPGTEKLANEVGRVLDGDSKVAILENHGLFITGNTMEECYDNLEDLDLVCKIQRNAGKLGVGLKTLDQTIDQGQISEYMSFNPPQFKKNKVAHGPDCKKNTKERELIISLLKRLYDREISTSKNVCFSYRLENGEIIVNPENKDIARLAPEDLVVFKEGCIFGKSQPHRDFYIHKSILENNKNINCVITSRPPYVMAYGVSNHEYTTRMVPECYWCLSNIGKIGFSFGEKLTDLLNGYFDQGRRAAIIENNMFIVTGQDPLKAYDRLEVAEATAEAIIETFPIAKPVEIDDASVRDLDRFCPIPH